MREKLVWNYQQEVNFSEASKTKATLPVVNEGAAQFMQAPHAKNLYIDGNLSFARGAANSQCSQALTKFRHTTSRPCRTRARRAMVDRTIVATTDAVEKTERHIY